MLIIKKSSLITYNTDIQDKSLAGIQLQGVITDDKKRPLKIDGVDGKEFLSDLSLDNALILNLHLYSQVKVTKAIIDKVAYAISRIPGEPNIILSSSQFFREPLRSLRWSSIMQRPTDDNRALDISIATPDDYEPQSLSGNDIILSTSKRLATDYEVGRITSYLERGVPVMLQHDIDKATESNISTILAVAGDENPKIMLLTANPNTANKL